MPREIVNIVVLRNLSVPDGAGGYTQTEAAISGSPFAARVYRTINTNIGFAPEMAGTTDADRYQVVSFISPDSDIRIDDIAVLNDGTRARVIRVRQYKRTLQCDVEVGVDQA